MKFWGEMPFVVRAAKSTAARSQVLTPAWFGPGLHGIFSKWQFLNRSLCFSAAWGGAFATLFLVLLTIEDSKQQHAPTIKGILKSLKVSVGVGDVQFRT